MNTFSHSIQQHREQTNNNTNIRQHQAACQHFHKSVLRLSLSLTQHYQSIFKIATFYIALHITFYDIARVAKHKLLLQHDNCLIIRGDQDASCVYISRTSSTTHTCPRARTLKCTWVMSTIYLKIIPSSTPPYYCENQTMSSVLLPRQPQILNTIGAKVWRLILICWNIFIAS